MLIRKIVLECPNCGNNFKASYISSSFTLSHNTDLSCIGLCRSTPFLYECKQCKYIFLETHPNLNKEKLNNLISSDEYQTIYKRYIDKNRFLIVHFIYINMQRSILEINQILLLNYYSTKRIDDLKLLVENYKIYINEYQYHNQVVDGHILFANALLGEYYNVPLCQDHLKILFYSIPLCYR